MDIKRRKDICWKKRLKSILKQRKNYSISLNETFSRDIWQWQVPIWKKGIILDSIAYFCHKCSQCQKSRKHSYGNWGMLFKIIENTITLLTLFLQWREFSQIICVLQNNNPFSINQLVSAVFLYLILLHFSEKVKLPHP